MTEKEGDRLAEEGGDRKVKGLCFDEGLRIQSTEAFFHTRPAGNSSRPHTR